MQLFIHVPMAPTNLMLCTLKFHPFLRPFTDTHFLLPGPENTLLTLSPVLDHYYAEMNHAALVDCPCTYANQFFTQDSMPPT